MSRFPEEIKREKLRIIYCVHKGVHLNEKLDYFLSYHKNILITIEKKTYKIILEISYAFVEIFVINVQQCDNIKCLRRFESVLLAEKFYLPKHVSFLQNNIM